MGVVVWIVWVVLIAATIGSLVNFYRPPSWYSYSSFHLGAIALWLLGSLWHWRSCRELKGRVIRASGRVCADCAFDVSGCPEEGRCPECGVAYEHHELQNAWRTWF